MHSLRQIQSKLESQFLFEQLLANHFLDLNPKTHKILNTMTIIMEATAITAKNTMEAKKITTTQVITLEFCIGSDLT